MIRRLFSECLVRPSDVAPSRDDMEVVGTFNPGAIAVTDSDGREEVVLLVRVAERPRERRAGHVASPRWDADRGLTIDWLAEGDIDMPDPRGMRIKATGIARLTFISHLRVVRSRDGRRVTALDGPTFAPAETYEEFGVEDARITRIGDTFYFTYVSVSRHGAATALASTKDFATFERHGIIFPTENKDVVLFPERIGGQYVALHRPNGATPFTAPEVWLARSPDLIHWGRHEILLGGGSGWDASRVGAGTPPIRVSEGWLEIYHGNVKGVDEEGVGVYCAAAAMLHPDQPWRILR